MSKRSPVLGLIFARLCLVSLVAWAAAGDVSAQSAEAPPPPPPKSETSDQRIQARLLDKQLRSVRIQELLIESGNLDKEAGHVSQPVLNAAARDFRTAIGSA